MEASNLPTTPRELEPIHPGSGRGKSVWKRIRGWLVAAGVVIANFAAKAKALLLILPKIKVFSTSASMLVSIAAYSLFWGWTFALGFVVLLFVHEMGHVFQLRREGVPASAPLFIPFMGAVVGMKSMPKDAGAEARVGLAGPVLGSLATLVPLGIWLATGSDFWRALAFVGFFLNLINLLPVLPLDGGRAMAALSPWVWIAGYASLVALTIFFPNPIMFLILVLGGLESWRRFKNRNSPEGRAYHQIPARTRLFVAVVYLGLALALGIAVHETHLAKSLSQV